MSVGTWILVAVASSWFWNPFNYLSIGGYKNRADCETARDVMIGQMSHALRWRTEVICVPPPEGGK